MKFICSSCGAEIDDNMPKCPYCDTLIPKGAEAAYMDRLYDIQEDMEELNEIPYETVKEEIKHQGKRVKKIFLITAVIVAVLAVTLLLNEKKYDRDHTADYIWEQKTFPIMSELYEKEQFEELDEIYYAALMENRSIWNWEYFDEYSKKYEERTEKK